MFDEAVKAEEAGDTETALRLYAARLDGMSRDEQAGARGVAVLRRMVGLLAALGDPGRIIPQFAALSPVAGDGDAFRNEFATVCRSFGIRAFSAQRWAAARYYLLVAQLNGLGDAFVTINAQAATHNVSMKISQAVMEIARRTQKETDDAGQAYSPEPDRGMRATALSRKLSRLNRLQTVTVGVVTPNLYGMIGNKTLLRAGEALSLFGRSLRVSTYATLEDLVKDSGHTAFDIVICTNNAVHQQDHFMMVHDLRRTNENCITTVWLWDSHHLHEICSLLSYIFDAAVPAHEIATNFLKVASPNVFGCVPAGVFQWTRDEAESYFRKHADQPRSNALYGAFIAYQGYERDRFIEQCRAEIADNALYLRGGGVPVEQDGYRRLSPEGQFAAWMGYKVSLVATIKTDIPVRLFDALLTGQIPLVPSDLEGFDQLVPIRLQHELPILRYNRHSVASVAAAHRQALALFDAEGVTGVLRRHAYAAKTHMMADRIADILGKILLMARSAG